MDTGPVSNNHLNGQAPSGQPYKPLNGQALDAADMWDELSELERREVHEAAQSALREPWSLFVD